MNYLFLLDVKSFAQDIPLVINFVFLVLFCSFMKHWNASLRFHFLEPVRPRYPGCVINGAF